MKHLLLTLLITSSLFSFAQNIPAYVPQCGLRAWYPFSGNPVDSTLHGNDGQVYGATLTTDRFGQANSAYFFNGNSDYIYVPPYTNLATSLDLPGSVSISAWTRSSQYNGQRQIFWRGDNQGAVDQYMLYTFSGGDIGMRRDVDMGYTTLTCGISAAAIDSQFHHFVVTYDSATGYMRVYYDGTLAQSCLAPGMGTYPTATFFNVIGAVNYMSSWQFFEGKIDDIGVWERALDSCEVKGLYLAQVVACADSSHSTLDTTLCASQAPIALSGRSTYSTFQWSNNSTSPTIVVFTSGTYWVYSFDADCGVAIDTFNVTFVPSDTTSSYSDTTLCSTSMPISLVAPSGYTSWQWNTGSTLSSVVVNSPGLYWVQSIGACGMATDSVNVIVVTNDTAYKVTDTTICGGTLATLSAPSGYTSYSWSTGATTASITASQAGTYWAASTVGGCYLHVDTFHLSLDTLDPDLLPADTSVCSGSVIQLVAVEHPLATYSWNTGSNAPSISVSGQGMYILTVSRNGCVVVDTTSVTRVDLPFLYLGPDTIICNATTFTLNAHTANVDYLWSTGGNTSSIKVTDDGDYICSVYNICGSATDTIRIDFEKCTVGVPTAFSPNGDGVNDILYVRGSGIIQLEFNVFNRFGQIVFHTTDPRLGWDGTFKGTEQPAESYAFTVRAQLADGVVEEFAGNVTLLR